MEIWSGNRDLVVLEAVHIHVALEKNNFRITCSLLVIAADTCLLGSELPFTSKLEKCLSVLE